MMPFEVELSVKANNCSKASERVNGAGVGLT